MAGCSLNKSSKHNWIENEGGLPEYICEIARAIARGGKDLESAIPIAISRCKVWASGKGVNKKTQAKAAGAVAEWERKKASAKAKKTSKVAASVIDLSEVEDEKLSRGEEVLLVLSVRGYDPHPGLVRVLARVGGRSGV
jgi:uncharacterized protein YdaT